MGETVLVNFHSHTIFSDGDQTPEALAANLAAAGVRFAALTDHDSLEGLPRFQEALKKHGIAFLSGVELTARYQNREVHLLGYGFDPQHPELLATLQSLRQTHTLEVISIAGSLRKAGSAHRADDRAPAEGSAAPQGYLEMEQAISLIHCAGGLAFLAHPFTVFDDPLRLEAVLKALVDLGLDGIEAVYSPYSPEQQERLRQLAEKYHLLISAGSDVHGTAGKERQTYAVAFPREDWERFRTALLNSPGLGAFAAERSKPSSPAAGGAADDRTTPQHFRRRSYALRIFLPTLTAILLFLGVIWGFVMPSFEQSLMDRKRELIRELTNSAWSILASYQADVLRGELTLEQAQRQAAKRIEALRYGPEGLDYFWIQDTSPRMIMHPYRSDLNGQSLKNFTDARGARIFVEFASLVKSQGEGYIDYVWQWKDDPNRLEPKESYVKGFEPWGWIIGTGIYIDDVAAEIARIEQGLVNTILAISGVIVLLLLFVLQQSLRIERQRQEVVDTLRESTERYQSLVEAATEGTLFVLDGRCRYANPIFLQILGYHPHQLDFLELEDVLPLEEENQPIWDQIHLSSRSEQAAGKPMEGLLRRADGSLMECILAVNPVHYAGQDGLILLARDVRRKPADQNQEDLGMAALAAPLGIFRARAQRRCPFLAVNPAGWALMDSVLGVRQPRALADLFPERESFNEFYRQLIRDGTVFRLVLQPQGDSTAGRAVALSAALALAEDGSPEAVSGILEDVSREFQQRQNQEEIIARLQSSLLFLHETVTSLCQDALRVPMDTPVGQLARLMSARQVSAVLIESQPGTAVGIVTDHDLRARVLAEQASLSLPAHAVMTAPLVKIADTAHLYEALMLMEERGVRHLAVEAQDGRIVGLVDSKSLVQFRRYGPIVLTREIERSGSAAEIVQCSQRAPLLARALLESSARPQYVTGMLASTCDAASRRFIELGLDALGPPPAPFAFIAMGSQGRKEQTLLTDQDNGIIFLAEDGQKEETVQPYFLRLSEWVCKGLEEAGYAACRGGVMARNPRWCRSLQGWKDGIDAWLARSEPEEILQISIFFDFRAVYGESELAAALRTYVNTALSGENAVFYHLAQNALSFKPPIRLPGNIYLGSGSSERAGELNLKDAMMPLVSFARLYSLRYQLSQTHTLERLEALVERGLLHPATRDEMSAAYEFLTQLRLQAQIEAITAGKPPQNLVQINRLGYTQQEILKQAFSPISAAQKKISFEFLGGG